MCGVCVCVCVCVVLCTHAEMATRVYSHNLKHHTGTKNHVIITFDNEDDIDYLRGIVFHH